MQIIEKEKSLTSPDIFNYGCCPDCEGDGCERCEESGKVLLPCLCPYEECNEGFETMEELGAHAREVHHVTTIDMTSDTAH